MLFGYDLFLSHAHNAEGGRDYAVALWPRLEELGFTTCFDAADFHAGEPLHVKMRRSVSSSKVLVLLDTPAARAPRPVARAPIAVEVATAVDKGIPIIVIRQEGLTACPWPGVDGEGELIRVTEPVDAFRRGAPGDHVVAGIAERYRWTLVRTKFAMALVIVAIALVSSGMWFGLEMLFEDRVAGIYASLHDERTPIRGVDDTFERLRTSLVLGTLGRWRHTPALTLLDRERDRLHAKHLPWGYADTLQRAGAGMADFTRPFTRSDTLAFAPDVSIAVAIQNGAPALHRGSRRTACRTLGAAARKVAVDPDGQRIAVASEAGVHVWIDSDCTAEPITLRPPALQIDPQDVTALAFGDEGRSLLVGDGERLVVFRCDSSPSCIPARIHRAEEVRAPGAPGGGKFCEVVISPRDDLVVANLGDCRGGGRRQLCAFSVRRTCVEQDVYQGISFDPTGEWLIAARPHLARFSLGTLNGMDSSEWAPDQKYELVSRFDVLAFAGDGSRLLTATLYDDFVAVMVYQWPDLAPLQTLTLDTDQVPVYMIAGSRVVIGVEAGPPLGRRQFTLDLRQEERARAHE